jgi:hypothetical protein
MVKTPKYIEHLENQGVVFSTIEINFETGIEKFLDDRSFLVVWSNGFATVKSDKITINQKIYKTKQGFFLYLLLGGHSQTLTIYYKQEQMNELTVFLTQLLKQFKNGTTINK